MPINSFENYPMSWKPVLPNSNKPIYIYLANTLEEDILNGKLTHGTKLLPQRELADYLDINLSTVTRTFKLCEQRDSFVVLSVTELIFLRMPLQTVCLC